MELHECKYCGVLTTCDDENCLEKPACADKKPEEIPIVDFFKQLGSYFEPNPET